MLVVSPFSRGGHINSEAVQPFDLPDSFVPSQARLASWKGLSDNALVDASKILAGSATGRVPSQKDVKTLERANLVALSMDQIVAEEMKLDGRTYRGIVEAVEAVVPGPTLTPASGSAAANSA